MGSRALSLAALALLVGLCSWTCAGVQPAFAQALDAGKPPAQIFNGTCAACHRSPRGLVRSVSPGSLPGFLRQHYTTGNDMAGTMATYVLGNGGTDRVAEPAPKREPKQEPKQKAKSDTPEVAARTPEAKEQAKAARQQKAGRKGAEPAAKDAPSEADKADAAKETPKTEPVAEPPKADATATDCKVEPVKQADDKPGEATPASANPRQPSSLLTLPGFPAPEPEPVAASPGCDQPATTAAAMKRADDPPKEAAKEAAKEAPKDEPKEAAKEPPPAPPAPAAEVAQVAKPEPLRPAVAETPPPPLDIMQEEVHAPKPARSPQQQKKRAP